MTKKIVILGGGIGGLTVAHELAHKEGSQYDIHIYERNNIIGGMARSGYKIRNGVKLPTEYCWRIYGPNYDNLREILKQIPLNDTPEKTVHDNLINISEYLIADQQVILKMNNRPKTLVNLRRAFKNIPLQQKLSVINKILYGFMISTERLNLLDNLTWKKYIDPDNSLCHDMKKYIIDIMGPYLGAEATAVNVPSVIKTLESFKIFNKPISVMCGPTNEVWFEHWQSYLESQGVIFHLNSEVVDIHTHGEQIKHALLANGEVVKSDVFFCCMPVESVAKLPSLTIPGISELAIRARQLMVSIQLYFDRKIPLPNKDTAMYIPDSPWQLVIEPQGSLWNKSYGDIADLWSIGLCDPTRPGLLIKKSFIYCSHEEIKNEVWHQIKISELGQYLNLNKVRVLDHNVWDTYVFDGLRLDTYEPKFSTNKGTFKLRPDNETRFKNFHFATAYTKTDTDMFEMESAAESGRRAARLLEKSVRVTTIDRPLFFTFYRWLDSLFLGTNLYKHAPFVFFCLGLPMLLMLPFVYLYRRFKKHYRD
jgi:hypothetical protein